MGIIGSSFFFFCLCKSVVWSLRFCITCVLALMPVAHGGPGISRCGAGIGPIEQKMVQCRHFLDREIAKSETSCLMKRNPMLSLTLFQNWQCWIVKFSCGFLQLKTTNILEYIGLWHLFAWGIYVLLVLNAGFKCLCKNVQRIAIICMYAYFIHHSNGHSNATQFQPKCFYFFLILFLLCI